MVIETSALVAMLTDEPDAQRFEAAVEADPVRLMSTASYLEAAIVIEQMIMSVHRLR
jgi:ribonuclease VapC